MTMPWTYQSHDGEWRAYLNVTARAVKFLGGRSETGPAAAPEEGAGEPAPLTSEEEIPF